MQNIGTPRIYVDWGSWLKAIGKFEFLDTGNLWANYGGGEDVFNPIFGLNPSKQTTFNVGNLEGIQGGDTRCFVRVSSGCFYDNPDAYPNYMAVLGHNYASATCRVYPETYASGYGSGTMPKTEIINYGSSVGSQFPPYDGFTIIGIPDPDTSNYRWKGIAINMVQDYNTQWADENFFPYTDDVNIGSFCYGRFYDFPHSPELKITQSIEMGELTRQQSVIGGSLSNSMQTPDMWGDLGAWELDSPSEQDDASKLGIRRGKRIWNLSFSYLSDKDTLPINALGNTIFDIANASSYDSTDYTDGAESAYFNSNVLDGEDFFSAVWNRTLGGHLPFIFQPDKDNNNPDQFAICKFDQDSLEVKQVANTVYNVKLKIREI